MYHLPPLWVLYACVCDMHMGTVVCGMMNIHMIFNTGMLPACDVLWPIVFCSVLRFSQGEITVPVCITQCNIKEP